MNDNVEHPAHYDFGQIEAREIIELAIADFADTPTAYHVASALKYLLRASRKGGSEDIAKARKHVGWAEDAARAYDIRRLRDIPSHYDPAAVAFRHGDLDKVCGDDPEVYRCYPPITELHPRSHTSNRSGCDVPHSGNAFAAAFADGAGEYGNPITSWRLP